MSRDAALQRYTLSSNEFSILERAYDAEGVVGLRDRRLRARRLGAPPTQPTFGQVCGCPRGSNTVHQLATNMDRTAKRRPVDRSSGTGSSTLSVDHFER